MIEEKDTDEKPETKDSDDEDNEILFYGETEDVDFAKLCAGDIDPELKDLLEVLNKDPELEKELSSICSGEDLDILKEKSKIVHLIQIYLARMKNIELISAQKLLKKRDRAITDHLVALGHYLIMQKAQSPQEEKSGFFKKLENKLFSTMSQSMKNFRDAVKRFVVYEIYEIQNPKRIAGETKVKNFVHNMILGGFKKASKYEGGRPQDIKHYKREFIEKLERQHRKLALDGKVPFAASETPGKVKPKSHELEK